MESAEVVRNNVEDDSEWNGTLRVTGVDSVMRASGNQMNHYEIRVAQNRIEVWATDPFDGALESRDPAAAADRRSWPTPT